MSKYQKWDAQLNDYFDNVTASELIKDSRSAGISLVYGQKQSKTSAKTREIKARMIGDSTHFRRSVVTGKKLSASVTASKASRVLRGEKLISKASKVVARSYTSNKKDHKK